MDATGAHGYVIKKVGEVPRNKIGKTVEELYEYSENLISQGYDCYEKVQAYLKELVKKEQIKKEEDNGARWSKWKNGIPVYPGWKDNCPVAKSCHEKSSCPDGTGESKTEAAEQSTKTAGWQGEG